MQGMGRSTGGAEEETAIHEEGEHYQNYQPRRPDLSEIVVPKPPGEDDETRYPSQVSA